MPLLPEAISLGQRVKNILINRYMLKHVESFSSLQYLGNVYRYINRYIGINVYRYIDINVYIGIQMYNTYK